MLDELGLNQKKQEKKDKDNLGENTNIKNININNNDIINKELNDLFQSKNKIKNNNIILEKIKK